MLWFMRRLLIVWLILAATGAVIVVIARREPLPDTLQAFGFDDCAGEPCLRGVTVGTSLDQTMDRLPDASYWSPDVLYVLFDKAKFGIGSEEAPWVYFIKVVYDQAIESFFIGDAESLKVPVWRFVTQYGSPCRVKLYIENSDLAQSGIQGGTRKELK